MRERTHFWLAAMTALLVGGLGAPELPGQEPPRKSEIRGTVVAAADRSPVVGARVSLEGTAHSLLTDKKGRFKFPKVAAGEYVIRAEVDGFPPATSSLRIARDERLDIEFQVGDTDAVTLPDVEVEAESGRVSPVREFNRRATTGAGRYITRDFIERRRAASVMDLLRSAPGVRLSCPRSARVCTLHFARHKSSCGPAYFLDGIPADPAILWLTNPNDLEGIELYSGPAETPPELEGVRSACGAIVMWSRVGEKPN